MDANLVVVGARESIAKDTRLSALNKMGFVRGDTDRHQWFMLVNEAASVAKVPIKEAVRDYLATMLWRFMTRADLLEQLAAFDFYRHVFGVATAGPDHLQDIADITLQYVAFFPERSRHRRQPRSLEYIAYIGTSLYLELAMNAEGKDDWYSRSFYSMATSFGRAVMVLRSACPRFALQREVSRESLRRKEHRTAVSSDAMRAQDFLATGLMYVRS